MMEVTWYHIPLSASNLWTKNGWTLMQSFATCCGILGIRKKKRTRHENSLQGTDTYPAPRNQFWQIPATWWWKGSISFRLKFLFFCHQKADTEPQKVPPLGICQEVIIEAPILWLKFGRLMKLWSLMFYISALGFFCWWMMKKSLQLVFTGTSVFHRFVAIPVQIRRFLQWIITNIISYWHVFLIVLMRGVPHSICTFLRWVPTTSLLAVSLLFV